MVYYSERLISPDWSSNGLALFSTAEKLGWEGVVGKRLDQPYQFHKRAWLKVKVWQDSVFKIVGYAPGSGR